MKKIISIFAAMAIMMSLIATSAYATADVTFTSKGVKTSYAAGATALVRVTISAPNGFEGFATTFTYDKTAFDYVSATASTDLKGTMVANGETKPGEVYCTFGTTSPLMPTGTEFDEELGEDVEKTYSYYVTYRFTVKAADVVTNGDYSFGLAEKGTGNLVSAGNVLVGEYSGCTLTVTGGIEPPTDPVLPVITTDPIASSPASATYKDAGGHDVFTQGIVGNIDASAADTAISKFKMVLTDTTASLDSSEFDFTADTAGITGHASLTFGINVLNVPADHVLSVKSITPVAAE